MMLLMQSTAPLITLAAVALLSAGPLSAADPLPYDRGSAGLQQSLRRIASPYRVLHITAHPDDEDGGTLTYLSRGLGSRVVLASVTRGESGANLVTGDFFDALGLLRTLELEKASAHYGAEPRFTRFADYGYSKSADEALRQWDREALVGDLVRIIRRERPHVVLSRWRGNERDGHGQHQAAGVVSQEAFSRAGDPASFPQQIRAGLEPWAPLKLYLGNYREAEDWTVAADSGRYDPLLGMSYYQLARQGLRYQRSQGAGSAIAAPGPALRYYRLAASRVGSAEKERSFFERIELSRPRSVLDAVVHAKRAFGAGGPSAAAPALLGGLQAVRAHAEEIDDAEYLEALFQTGLDQALGVSFEALVVPHDLPQGPRAAFIPYQTFALASPGQSFDVAASFHSGGGAGLAETELIAPVGWRVEPTEPGRWRVTVPADAPPTDPYWRRDSPWDASYRLLDDELFGRARRPSPLIARARYQVKDSEGEAAGWIETPVETSYRDATGVQRRRALAVAPAVSVAFPSPVGVLPAGTGSYEVGVRVSLNGSEERTGVLGLYAPSGWRSEPAEARFELTQQGEQRELTFRLTAPDDIEPGQYPVRAEARYGGARSDLGFSTISYGELDTAYLSQPARHAVGVVDVATAPELRVGYVMGTGDDVPGALGQLGVAVDLLDESALRSADLSRYHTILLGIRAYAVREDLKTHNARLLDYVNDGGVLVVQYNTPEFDSNYGPYPYTMGRRPEEVSEEDSPVRILEPSRSVFQWPNPITEADFDGWVEQRGSKFLAEWDPAYVTLIETQDQGQSPQQGGWLEARHGKGLYVYCAYAWYRQLPYGVPGAVRLFANLVSLGSDQAPWRNE